MLLIQVREKCFNKCHVRIASHTPRIMNASDRCAGEMRPLGRVVVAECEISSIKYSAKFRNIFCGWLIRKIIMDSSFQFS